MTDTSSKAEASKTDNSGKKEEGGLDDDSVDVKLKLLSSDNVTYEVDRKVATMSELIKTMVEGDKDETEIPLPNVHSKILAKIIDYMKHHTGNPAKEISKPIKSNNMKELVSDWDATFVEVDQQVLFDLTLASNYMDIKPLLDLTCCKIASMIKGKKPEDIRKTFNIQNDFTPEEEKAVREENKWIEEDA